MDEVLKILTEISGGSILLGLCLWLAKEWAEVKLVEPIKKLEEDLETVKKELTVSTERLHNAAFGVATRTIDMHKTITDETQKMSNMFSQTALRASEAAMNARSATEHSQAFEKEAEQKLRNVGANLLGKIKVVEQKQESNSSEIIKLKDDMILIKGKK